MNRCKLALLMPAAALVFISGCHHTTSNRTSYCAQPAVVATAPVATPCCPTPVAPCPTACPTPGVVPPPPPGFAR
jgi:hypothetical protein